MICQISLGYDDGNIQQYQIHFLQSEDGTFCKCCPPNGAPCNLETNVATKQGFRTWVVVKLLKASLKATGLKG